MLSVNYWISEDRVLGFETLQYSINSTTFGAATARSQLPVLVFPEPPFIFQNNCRLYTRAASSVCLGRLFSSSRIKTGSRHIIHPVELHHIVRLPRRTKAGDSSRRIYEATTIASNIISLSNGKMVISLSSSVSRNKEICSAQSGNQTPTCA